MTSTLTPSPDSHTHSTTIYLQYLCLDTPSIKLYNNYHDRMKLKIVTFIVLLLFQVL